MPYNSQGEVQKKIEEVTVEGPAREAAESLVHPLREQADEVGISGNPHLLSLGDCHGGSLTAEQHCIWMAYCKGRR